MQTHQTQYKEPKHGHAGFWLRVGAYIIDSVVLTVDFSLIGLASGAFSASQAEFFQYVYPGTIALTWLYFALLESSPWQATLGKRLVHIKVTNAQGGKITFARATGRHFAKILSSVILGIGYLMVAFTKHKQGLHDILAKTLVVKSE